jgi:hypothetical protein
MYTYIAYSVHITHDHKHKFMHLKVLLFCHNISQKKKY